MKHIQNTTTGELLNKSESHEPQHTRNTTPHQSSEAQELFNTSIYDLNTINGQIKHIDDENRRNLNELIKTQT